MRINKVVKLLLAVCLFSANVSLVNAQGVVTGVVLDANSNEPLPAATVRIEGTTTGIVTGLDGTFSLKVPEGKQTIVFSFVGYGDVSREVNLKTNRNLGEILLEPETIGLEEIMVVSSIVRDRQTPVAVSTIKAEVIIEKLGSQEFPEILKSTPSVYATKDGGGFGDGRINLRGFDSNNIGVLINGVPVNDMENGRVYWSNWAGLSDVTQTMQVQRGLGASRLAISSVGGTINIVTQSTKSKKGGTVFYGFGHDGYQRTSLSLSTGLMDNGWSITALGGKTSGQGFVDGADFEGWSYFLNVSKKVNENHILSFTAFGAPQWHNQRYPRQLIQTYREHPRGIRYNPSLGLYNGEIYSSSHNEYHKPQLSFNHYWSINESTSLSTAVYASISSGGGRRIIGDRSDWLQFDRDNGLPTDATLLTPDGFLDFDAVVQENAQSTTGSQAVVANSVNAHDWFGTLSTFQHDLTPNIKLTGGLDLRYYKGYHYQEITDLLGGSHYEDVTRSNTSVTSRNINRDPSVRLGVGDKIAYHNLGEVSWGGLFAQAEYATEEYSGFISSTFSNTNYRRTDYFQYEDDDPMQQTDWINFYAYSIKGGGNYNISDNHNVFVNAGYFTRAPFFRWGFIGYTNEVNEGVKNERVLSAEAGYGYRSQKLAANIILYRTEWLDKALVRNLGQGVIANITGLDALHQGIELDFTYRPFDKLEIRGMGSIGDWVWKDDLVAEVYDENQELLDVIEVYAGGLKVGNSAQTTASIGINYEVLPNLRLGVDGNHFDRLWADFNVEDRGDIDNKGVDSWRMPSYQLVDLNLRYRFKVAGLNATLISNINNLFDTEAIRDATDGRSFDYDTATVYYGWGRTWTTSLRIKF